MHLRLRRGLFGRDCRIYLVSIKGNFVWMNELLYVYHAVYPLLFSSLFHCHIFTDCRCILNLLSHHPLPHHSNLTYTFLAGTNGLGTVS